MKKKVLTAVLAILILALICCFGACKNTDEPGTDSTDVPATATESAATKEPDKETAQPTAETTPEPATEAPTREPKPSADTGGVDAILIDLSDEYYYTCSDCEPGDGGDIWLTLVSTSTRGYFTIMYDEEVDVTEYPYIAFLYRVGYGQSVSNTNHLYAITLGGGAQGVDGWYTSNDFISDKEWHLRTLNIPEDFTEAANNEWTGLRIPVADNAEGEFAVAWFGLFKTEEDIAAYEAKFNEQYGDKLVPAEAPKIEKQERIPNDLEDAFEEVDIDFEDMSSGSSMGAVSPFGYRVGTNGSAFADTDLGVSALLKYDAFYYDALIKSGKGYTITFDYMNNGGGGTFGGFVFNWGNESNEKRDFFENNGYEKDPEGSLVSHSGCGLAFQGDASIKIYVPIWDNDAARETYVSALIDAPVDVSANFATFKVDDDGTGKVTVSVNDSVLFTLEYSNDGLVDGAPTRFERYYRTVKITGADGTELLSTDSALFSVYKSFAFGARAHDTYFDNISIRNK